MNKASKRRAATSRLDPHRTRRTVAARPAHVEAYGSAGSDQASRERQLRAGLALARHHRLRQESVVATPQGDRNSDLGLNPNIDGAHYACRFRPQRKSAAKTSPKVIKKKAEEIKLRCATSATKRSTRSKPCRRAARSPKTASSACGITLQKITDKYVKEIDALVVAKKKRSWKCEVSDDLVLLPRGSRPGDGWAGGGLRCGAPAAFGAVGRLRYPAGLARREYDAIPAELTSATNRTKAARDGHACCTPPSDVCRGKSRDTSRSSWTAIGAGPRRRHAGDRGPSPRHRRAASRHPRRERCGC